MTNTLYLPELREALAENNAAELKEFCTALHPARTAEFMEGLTAEEAWAVLQHADVPQRVQIFGFFPKEKQIEIIETVGRPEIARFVGELPPDDRVDLLNDVNPDIVEQLMPLIPADERRDIQRLRAYPEESAGAVMTTEFARLSEDITVEQALREVGRQAEHLETIYYLYVVDEEDHLRGLVSARQLVSAMGKPNTLIRDLMERDVITVNVGDDQEDVAEKVARYDLLAIPVVDDEYRMLGIITHDDVIDVVREEAVEDAQQLAGVTPLEEGYLETDLLTLTRKRGVWLIVLFFGALLTAMALEDYTAEFEKFAWLVPFIPLVISTGGNSGSQSATLVITALSTGNIALADWWRVIGRELGMGALLGSFFALLGFLCALFMGVDARSAFVLPLTLVLVVICGTFTGSVLPLLFSRLGWDPALMSNPFVAGLIDLIGVVIYMNSAILLLDAGA